MKKLFPFLKYLKPYKGKFILAVLCGIIYGVSSGVGIPMIFEKVFKNVFEASENTYTTSQVIAIGASIPAIFAVRALFGFLNSYWLSFCAMKTLESIRQAVFDKVQTLPIAYFDKHETTDVMARVSTDPSAIQSVLLEFAAEMFRQPIQMLAACCTILYYCYLSGHFFFFLFLFIGAPLCVLPARIIRRKVKEKGKASVEAGVSMTQTLLENIQSPYEVRSYNLEDTQRKNYARRMCEYIKQELGIVRYQKGQQPVMEFTSALIICVFFVYAYLNKIPFSIFSTIGISIYFAVDPLKRIMNIMSNLHRNYASIDRINETLSYPSSVPENTNPSSYPKGPQNIVFTNLSFSYEDTPTLRDINITIPAGTSCALVGPSGAGKSTLTKLIPRFYDPSSGGIQIGDTAINEIQLKELRDHIGMVFQSPILFNDTVLNNIRIGNMQATEDEVIEAAKKAYAHDFIGELDSGYNTLVGERGDRLSGGQKQRIAIARAFLKDAPILILDEATSALDSNSEHFIQKAIDKLSEGRTVISIAHRLSTIKHADTILVFSEGKIIDSGTHDSLVKSNEIYRNFVEKQSLNS